MLKNVRKYMNFAKYDDHYNKETRVSNLFMITSLEIVTFISVRRAHYPIIPLHHFSLHTDRYFDVIH
jgi:hypothetical protein